MQLTRSLYHNSVLFFTGFSILVLWGFWRSYYSNPFQFSDLLVHVHGLSMTLWCAMLITQATLIRKGNRSLHRNIGKASYVLAPIIVFLLWAVTRYGIPKNPALMQDGALTGPGYYLAAVTLGGATVFGILYLSAVLKRKDAPVHGRLMLSTVFAIAAAATSRIVNYFPAVAERMPTVAGGPAPQIATWVIADTMLLGLAVWDWRERRRSTIFIPILALFFVYHVFAANSPYVGPWRAFCDWYFATA